MQTLLSNPVISAVASLLVVLAFYVWRMLGPVIEARTPMAVQQLLERIVPAVVEATEKVKAGAPGPDKLDFVFKQLDTIAQAYHMQFPDSLVRALIEQHVLTLPHTPIAVKLQAMKNAASPSNTNPNPVAINTLNTPNPAL